MRLYFKYVSTQLKTNFMYRSSTWMAMIGQTISTLSALLGVMLLFSQYNSVGGYTFNQILITFAVINFAFAFSEMIFRGFDQFDTLVRMGTLDALLLRPRNLVLQICGQKIETMKLGRTIFSVIILIVAVFASNVQWNIIKAIVYIEMIIAGVIVFFGVYLFTSSITIFTIQKPEFVNVLVYGGRDLCFYPLDVFKKWITKFFTFIVPYGVFNYIPLRYLLFNENMLIAVFSPLMSVVFAFLMYLLFNFCMKFYKSAG